VTVPALNVDKLAAKLSGLRFAPRTRIGVCAGFGSPGSITSGSVMGGSGASPGFSIGGGAGSGTGGKSPGGTPGLGAGGLGTCCAWSASNFSKTKVLSLRAAHGAVVAFADPQTLSRLVGSAEPALPGGCRAHSGRASPAPAFELMMFRRDLNQDHPRSGKDLGVEISFGEWMMAFGFAEFVIASLLSEYA
jgi:hypothetical protein